MTDMWNWYCGTLDHGLIAFAKRLRPKYQTGILSNSADGARRGEQGRYDFAAHFAPIIYSHEVGVAKPDSAIYALACRQLRCEPAEVLFLDDVWRLSPRRLLSLQG